MKKKFKRFLKRFTCDHEYKQLSAWTRREGGVYGTVKHYHTGYCPKCRKKKDFSAFAWKELMMKQEIDKLYAEGK